MIHLDSYVEMIMSKLDELDILDALITLSKELKIAYKTNSNSNEMLI
jgi:hypothetical protein